MNRTVTVRGVTIGEGIPKICVPLVGKTVQEIIEEAVSLKTLDLDMVEWRADFFEHVEDISAVKTALEKIRGILDDRPIIFTFRSASEGGNREVGKEFYFELNKVIAETELADIIDVELFTHEPDVKALLEFAHQHKVFVIISNHDFAKTPSKGEIVSRLRKAQSLGGDIPKIAVMPNSSGDVITLLDASSTMAEKHADRPFITISMGGKGTISRLSGEVFGSAITFASAKAASAPGQMTVNEVRKIIKIIHENK
ncbi:type I 3-dehydroquinate dehydratase [Neobacillus dielmonensis]|uniref:type I 3-dehydroquinate dehydratase n=1 Tax=Neobacillus dielmonensis TaxID=1347369 RepID=UPI0005A62153|nr:type I 3-dehydroquinate dehydratase [Neobacillus dielmonensis]